MRREIRRDVLAVGAAIAVASAAAAVAETVSYRYDARGRLVRVERNDSVANVATDYTFDKADNRTVKQTSGSPNPPPP
jgi:YD repeat-containing protein